MPAYLRLARADCIHVRCSGCERMSESMLQSAPAQDLGLGKRRLRAWKISRRATVTVAVGRGCAGASLAFGSELRQCSGV